MPFQYEGYRSPFANSIAELMLRRGDIAARQAEQSGNAWAGAAQTIGQAVAAIPQQIQQAKRADTIDQMNTLRLKQAQQEQAGQESFDTLLKGDTLPAGVQGPRQDSYLTSDGLFDVPKLNARLNQIGLAHMAPELLKGAEGINDSITKHQQLEQQMGQQRTLLLGDMADGVLKLAKAGTPIVQAMDFVVQPALATKRIQPQEYQQLRAQIAQLPPEQQQAALGSFMDSAAKLGGGKTLGKDAQELDRYGRVVASNVQPEKPTEASLAADAATLGTPQETLTAAASARAIDRLKPAPKRTDTEMALDAYAKSIKKTKAEDLTYAELRQFEKQKATTVSDQAFLQHMRERQYDISNPIPEKGKSQDALEQEGRTVLVRAMSSRSGGIGLEDAKVQQANHLLGMLDQFRDDKTGEINIPRVPLNELALGLAKLTAGTGPAGEGMMREFQQRTAKGDLAGALTYLTGQAVPANTQDITKMLEDSIRRQGEIAQENREGEMRYLRGLMPTGLSEERRTALEANTLNPLRQSRLAKDTKGTVKRFVSTDGGKTWK